MKVETEKPKSRIARWIDSLATLALIAMLTIFAINQIDQFFDHREEPTVVRSPDGMKCIHYRGSMGCVQIYMGADT